MRLGFHRGRVILLAAAIGILMTSGAWAKAENAHGTYVQGPIENGPQATVQCLKCHDQQAKDFMKTTHWTWSAKQTIGGKTADRGKKNAINNFCVSIASNEPRCTSCHAGYGWADKNFDFSNAQNIDCLVCHDTTGSYKKDGAGAGMPAKGIDLLKIAKNVGKPSRFNCGTCHFFGGGGDAVKHGDLDSSMEYPERKIDIHMGTDSNDFQCQECHKTVNHQITGQAMVVSPGGKDHIGCEKCHEAAPHKQSRLNAHAASVACQTCHIPYFAKELPTKLSWDWSTTGKDISPEPVDKLGKPTYDKKKGDFTWGKMVAPAYAWYNGTADAYLTGDKMDPTKVTKLTYPLGDIKDQNAKIYPFKVHTGKQIYDAKQNIFITPKVFGPGGYWKDFDWAKAAKLGMEASGLPYSGEYAFAPTIMYWRINHMVAPKKEALGCLDCHGDNGRIDWKALGYQGDPMDNPKFARANSK